MKRWAWWYGIWFLMFVSLVIIIMAQNLSSQWEVSLLRMKTTTTILALITWLFWLIQGILLTIFIKSFFTSMQRSELSKFDLDKPL